MAAWGSWRIASRSARLRTSSYSGSSTACRSTSSARCATARITRMRLQMAGRDLHGQLELVNLLTSERSLCDFTISRSSLVKVFPHVLRMSKKEDGSFETQFFSRVNNKDEMTPSAVQVTAKAGKKQITCRSFGKDTLRRHTLAISSELAETLLAEGSRLSNVSLHYQIVFNKGEDGPRRSSSYQLNVPILFRDSQ